MSDSKNQGFPDTEKIIEKLQERSCSFRQLVHKLHVSPSQADRFRVSLDQLSGAGEIRRSRGGVFSLPRRAAGRERAKRTLLPPKPGVIRVPGARLEIVGRLEQRQPGFAFLISEDPREPDVYISAADLLDALPDDRVRARILPAGREARARRRGKVLSVEQRARHQIVGRFRREGERGWVQADGLPFVREFLVPVSQTAGAADGVKVVAKVAAWPLEGASGRAEVIEILGKPGDPGLDITELIRRFELPEKFSGAALAEARRIAQPPAGEELAGRLDLRSERIVTIDGADARDFDDAVSCVPLPQGGWRLGVHIADVSHYLRENSDLDLEARERGTSVYLPDRVLHMLPEPLSTGVCSLVPDQDRLTVSAFMEVAPDGRVGKTEFYRSVIHSAGRLTYDGVEEVLRGRPTQDRAAEFSAELERLRQVSFALRKNRRERGSLDFDLPDSKVVLGPDGRVQTIQKRVQLESHRLIEDCMIAANEAVARYLARTDTPVLYRVHPAPSGEKLEELKALLAAYGYSWEGGKLREISRAYQKMLGSWQGKPEEPVLNMALLRSMGLAVYDPKNTGHFGLGSACYTHFTSPIRRYPDLVVHRMLNERLEKGPVAGRRRDELAQRLKVWGEQLSLSERRAEKAEREAVKRKQAEYMAGRVGEIFQGRITSVTHFGFFVELDDPFVEGLVRQADLPGDYFVFEERQRYLSGTQTGRQFRTGQSVTVKVAHIDPDAIRVIFILWEPGNEATVPPARRNRPHIVQPRPRGPRHARGKRR